MKNITFWTLCFVLSIGEIQAQNSLVDQRISTKTSISVEDLLERLDQIGTVIGNVNDYFSPYEQRLLQVHKNGLEKRAPIVLTQSNSQVIDQSQSMICGTHPSSFRDNRFYRVFDLVNDYGINDGFYIHSVDFAIDAVSTTSSFPLQVNIYSIADPNEFPSGLITLEKSTIYNVTESDRLSMVKIPIATKLPAGFGMIMELVLEDDGTDSHYITLGVNAAGETSSSFVKAPECGVNNPTTFSSLGYETGMIWNIYGDISNNKPETSGVEFFAINNTQNSVIVFYDTDPENFHIIGPSSATSFEDAGAFDPSTDSTAYVLDFSGSFYSVNVHTAEYDYLGIIEAPIGESWSGAEFDWNTNTLYAISTSLEGSTLSQIDIANRSKTIIGSTGIPGAISLIIDDNSQGYAHCIAEDALFSVDLVTGQGGFIGYLDFDANFSQGACWAPWSYNPYLAAFNTDTFSSEWREIDVNTGSSWVIGIFNNGDDQVAWVSPSGIIVDSIEDNVLKNVIFFPNPTQDIIKLQSAYTIESISIYTTLGQELYSKRINSASTELDLTSLQAGNYILKVIIDGKEGSYRVLRK